ncbi:Tn3 family transposase [Escherichia coli]|uniref:Tn3 family transposase n=1 Tax=Escherichia coli TaxID=562 RepID=UPI002091A857|nr:Tn3 family transposase [Escherichia coli]EIY0244047.1 Tn3 family transposase [Escherichia coli]EIY0244233.1 Tn3 family transposase [Escherichia coli]HCO6039209.1 Tn3 family transposase [Escherichia coli]HCO6039381.1 Tn3 family transposase [Escherichia coli]HCO7034874.1 Tn3 family transposase [Escherichia coli]
MPRRSILSAAERESLLALPDTKDELIRHYTFSETDLSIIRQRRGPANRLGFAVQLCYLRFPGVILGVDEPPFPPLLKLVADQLKVSVESWDEYGQREQTRREHLVELQTVFGFQPFTMGHYRQAVQLLTTILADAINLGLTKMAESCPGTTYAKLAWLQAWHIRDETYGAALADLVNAQFRHPFAEHWGDGTTSSSDGQNFRTGSKAESTGHINPKYGSSPGRTFYTHISDQYAPFHTKVVNVGVRDSTYVLDGLLYHESDLRIEEHYTDTAGFTDHVFALMHLLGFRFAPRIRDLGDTKLYIPKGDAAYDALKPMIGGTLNIKHVRAHWDEILRLATSIKQGTVTASLMLRKLGSYPRQNGLAVALRELGRIERTLFILDWLQSVELRRRVHAGLNKGEARNALARAVFFNRLGEIRDRSFEQQRYRASGLNLVTAAVVLWNTVYLERAAHALRGNGHAVDDALLQYLSPLGWEHINLTGDYLWRSSAKIGAGKFRPLRPLQPA